MAVLINYKIKYGKHIAFKHKDKKRFTQVKINEEDYTEDRLKERILDNTNQRTYTVKKCVRNIIDIANNEKVKSNKGYKYWATKHNLKTATDLSNIMEQVHTVKMYCQIYLEYKKDTSDNNFFEEHKSEITLYENALLDLKKSYSKLPNSKDILKELDSLHEKKEYPNARVFFFKTRYERTVSNQKKL